MNWDTTSRPALTRTCIVCSKEFIAHSGVATLCSNDCRNVHQRRRKARKRVIYERQCNACKLPFTTSHVARVTCSDDCSVRNKNMARLARVGKTQGLPCKCHGHHMGHTFNEKLVCARHGCTMTWEENEARPQACGGVGKLKEPPASAWALREAAA